jgi:peptide/nickel transport system substrate-binding protein
LSGDVDWADPIPLQDVQRVNTSGKAKVMQGPELRTIFLGFDQYRPELKYSDVKGKNPFKDVRVRKAFYLAIDENAIKDKVMRGAATASALMISPLLFDLSKDFPRPAYDPEGAKKLLAEAGYPNGFGVTMDCPNDRYVNDEAICQAVVAMLARVGVKIDLLAQPKAKYFAKVLVSGGYDTSFYLLGWTPGSFDSWNILANMYRCRDEKGVGGNNNLGNYCNPKMEELIKQVLVENDKGKRDQLIKTAYQLGQNEEWGYIPLHQQALAWGVSDKVKVVQRADNQILFYWFRKEGGS